VEGQGWNTLRESRRQYGVYGRVGGLKRNGELGSADQGEMEGGRGRLLDKVEKPWAEEIKTGRGDIVTCSFRPGESEGVDGR